MSAAWDRCTVTTQDDEKKSKRFIRLWSYLAIAGSFLMFVYFRLGISLF